MKERNRFRQEYPDGRLRPGVYPLIGCDLPLEAVMLWMDQVLNKAAPFNKALNYNINSNGFGGF